MKDRQLPAVPSQINKANENLNQRGDGRGQTDEPEVTVKQNSEQPGQWESQENGGNNTVDHNESSSPATVEKSHLTEDKRDEDIVETESEQIKCSRLHDSRVSSEDLHNGLRHQAGPAEKGE